MAENQLTTRLLPISRDSTPRTVRFESTATMAAAARKSQSGTGTLAQTAVADLLQFFGKADDRLAARPDDRRPKEQLHRPKRRKDRRHTDDADRARRSCCRTGCRSRRPRRSGPDNGDGLSGRHIGRQHPRHDEAAVTPDTLATLTTTGRCRRSASTASSRS